MVVVFLDSLKLQQLNYEDQQLLLIIFVTQIEKFLVQKLDQEIKIERDSTFES